ncbi:MAG TPA: hypothetical protein DEF36_13350 [Desulfotomaculum sp.]|nr:hypothetical protein [Desulfotomaculum sp.]
MSNGQVHYYRRLIAGPGHIGGDIPLHSPGTVLGRSGKKTGRSSFRGIDGCCRNYNLQDVFCLKGGGFLYYDAGIILAFLLVAVCTWTDIKERLIYNIFTYPAVLAGIILNILAGNYVNIYGGLIIFAMYLCFFLSGKMGAGDLKLAVALSLLLGIQPVLLGSFIAGIVLIAWGFTTTWYKTGQLQTAVMVVSGKVPGGEAPYGAVLGPATVLMAIMV